MSSKQAPIIDMPEAALYGRLGIMARHMELPLGASMVALTCLYAGHLINQFDEKPSPRPTQNALLIGPYGSGKTLTMDRAKASLFYPEDDNCIVSNTLASDRGLINACRRGLDRKETPESLRGIVITCDEMIGQVKKMSIEGSSLMQVMNEIWSKDRFGVEDKNGSTDAWARVSFVAGLTMEDASEFSTLFTSASRGGFSDRMVLAPVAKPERRNFKWKPKPYTVSTPTWFDDEPSTPTVEECTAPLVPTVQTKFDPDLHDVLDDWEAAYQAQGTDVERVREIVARYAVIVANANGDTEVSRECLDAAMVFGDWQLKLRGIYKAGDAEDPVGVVKQMMIEKMSTVHQSALDGKPVMTEGKSLVAGPIGRHIRRSLLFKKFNFHKNGQAMNAWKQLVDSGTLEEWIIREKGEKDHHTGCFMLTDFNWPSTPSTPMPTAAAEPEKAA